MATKKNAVNQLTWNVPITNPNGTPTTEFMRKWLQQGSQNSSVTDLSTAANVSAVLDLISAVKGSTLYRDTTKWLGLAPATGHDGWLLTFNNATGLPEWRVGAITAIPAAIWIDGLGDGYMALVDANGVEVLDGSGNAIYIKNPLLPAAMVPGGGAANPTAIGSDTVVNGVAATYMRSDAAFAIQKATNAAFGLAKGDGFSIGAAAGLIGTLFQGFLAQITVNQSVPLATYTKATWTSFIANTLGVQLVLATGVFTPTKAGNYFVFATLLGQTATLAAQCNTIISKNGLYFGGAGVIQALGVAGGIGGVGTATSTAMAVVPMNGTTDTLEIDAYVNGTGGSPILAAPACTFGAIYLGA